MGDYVREKTYLLEWAEDAEFAGLEVRMGTVPVDDYFRLGSVLDGDVSSFVEPGDEGEGPAVDRAYEWLLATTAAALISWNNKRKDGKKKVAVPTDLAGLRSMDKDFIWAVIRAWRKGMRTVPAPLSQPLSATERSAVEASIPMVALSDSQAS